MEIARIILQQLGGNKFLVMTGSYNLVYDDKSRALTMTLRKNKSKAKYLTIKLEADDTYTMLFKAKVVKNYQYTFPVVKEYKGVYFDMLQELFTEVTGMYTHL